MSVLYDALKKVENRDNKKHVIDVPVAVEMPGAPGPSAAGGGDSTRILAGAIVVAAMIAASVYLIQTRVPGSSGSNEGSVTPAVASKSATLLPGDNAATEPVSTGVTTETVPADTTATVVADPAKEALVYNQKGMELFKRSRYLDAIIEFKEAVNLDPTNAEPYNNMGLAYLWLGYKSEGEVAFKKALKISPDYPEALNNYGALMDRYWPGKRDKEATALFKKSIRFDPRYTDPHFNLAVLLERKGSYVESAKYYSSFLKRGGGNDAFNSAVKKKIKVLRSSNIY